MRIEVYYAEDLVALFESEQFPSYYGVHGRRVRALLVRAQALRDLRTGEAPSGRPDGGAAWWVADILSAGLLEAGFAIHAQPVVAGARQAAGEQAPRQTVPAPAVV